MAIQLMLVAVACKHRFEPLDSWGRVGLGYVDSPREDSARAESSAEGNDPG